MVAQQLGLVRQRRIIGRDHAAVAEGAEVLRREKAEAAEVSDGAGAAPLVLRADRLRAVLDHVQVVPLGDRHNRIHVGHLSVQVHGHDHLGFRCDRGLDQAWLDVVAVWIDVHEHRHCAHPVDAAARGEEGVRRGDDFIAALDAEGHKRYQKRVGARGDADAELTLRVRGDFFFQTFDLRAADEGLRLRDALERRVALSRIDVYWAFRSNRGIGPR